MHFGALLRLGLDDRRDPLTRGSMGHVGAAHLHARWMREQQGEDPTVYYAPEDAMHEWCVRNPEGWSHFDRMLEVYRRYVARYPEPPGTILGVEHLIAGVLGFLDGQWGLWACSPDDVESTRPVHVGGKLIEPTPLDFPGNAEHGKNIFITRRLDLTIRDLVGRVYIVDHKYKAVEVRESTGRKYAMSGEFAVSRVLGKQVWPDLMGLQLWLIQTARPWNIAQPVVPNSPWRDALFPRNLWDKAHEIARCERDYPDLHHWPMAQNEVSCVGRYERDGCPAMDACMRGAAFMPRR
jgi:hypothetical protein